MKDPNMDSDNVLQRVIIKQKLLIIHRKRLIIKKME
jgi:hypothetical protein